MKQLFSILIFLAAAVLQTTAKNGFANETLHYKVMYKWGLINKQAGTVSIRLDNKDPHYYGLLTAKSDPWADKFYRVRDTLRCTIVKEGLKSIFYEKISHEGSEDKHDVVRYERSGANVVGHCTRVAYKDGRLRKNEKRTLESYGTTVDMLTAFYYMRALPYQSWQKGHVMTVNIFSGKRKELLTIKYMGTERVKFDGKSFDCFRISFIFTSDGKTKTSDDMDAWITTSPERIPVKLEGKLPVGKVRCFYTG